MRLKAVQAPWGGHRDGAPWLMVLGGGWHGTQSGMGPCLATCRRCSAAVAFRSGAQAELWRASMADYLALCRHEAMADYLAPWGKPGMLGL